MFGLFTSVAKAALSAVTVHVAVVADVATLGGALTDRATPYTAEAVRDTMQNLKDTTSNLAIA